jgi:hypothetical protein
MCIITIWVKDGRIVMSYNQSRKNEKEKTKTTKNGKIMEQIYSFKNNHNNKIFICLKLHNVEKYNNCQLLMEFPKS